ncbi:MAG: ABC transporter substrate-binding protein, partial [Nitrososphaerales archaeon]
MQKVSGLLAILLLLGVAPSVPILQSEAQGESGTYFDEIVFIHFLDENIAAREVQAGNLDTYFWRVPLDLAAQLKSDPDVRIIEAPGGTLSLAVNPAPIEGGLNPLSITEVRFALNFLINRDFVVNEILRGFGAPMVTNYGPFDPDFLVVADTIEDLNFRHSPEFATSVITKAMQEAGATLQEGKWFYNEDQVTIKFLIRSDDPVRKSIGELLSSNLEEIGFTVDKEFGDLTKAFDVVYGSNPTQLEWQLYTEGWQRSAFVKFDTVSIAQMYGPWFGNMPGWGESTYWGYENDTLDDLTQRITTGNFTSKDERDDLIRRATDLGMKESVRIFVASRIDPYIANRNVEGLVNDFGAGITNRWSLINSRVSDSQGGTLRVGMKQIYQGAWNPITNMDFYAQKVWGGVNDPASWTHPHSGDIIPLRLSWDVETEGPDGTLDVPSDATVWDPIAGEWKQVGSGVKATSKVIYDLKLGDWHHGEPINKADILYWAYFFFEWGTNTGEGDQTIDPEYTSSTEPFVETIKGLRFVDDDELEVYVDFWFFDEGFIADYASFWADTPWEVGAAMERLVLEKKFAFSSSASRVNKVEWISSIIKGHAESISETLKLMGNEGTVPNALEPFVDQEEAKARYSSSVDWIEEFDHAVISNGPYFLKNYNPDARTITIKAFQDSQYPIPLGFWNDFETLKTAKVKRVDTPSSVLIGDPARIRVAVEVGDLPSSEAVVNYRVVGPDGKSVVKGIAQPLEIGSYLISIS